MNRSTHCLALPGEAFLYLVGGRFRGWTLRSCERLSLAHPDRGWEVCEPLLENRGSHGLAACGSTLLAVGGGGRSSNLLSCETLNVQSGAKERWQAGPDSVFEARHAQAVCAHGNRVYCVGGWARGSEGSPALETCEQSSAGIFGPWSRRSPMAAGRRLHGAAFADERLVVFGGLRPDGPTAAIEAYDPAEDRWEAVGEMPVRGAACAAAVEGGGYQVFVQSGLAGGAFRYDGGRLRPTRPLPLPDWYGMCAASLGSDVFLLGGTSAGSWTKAAWRYCSLTDNWHHLPPISASRRRAAAAVVIVPTIE